MLTPITLRWLIPNLLYCALRDLFKRDRWRFRRHDLVGASREKTMNKHLAVIAVVLMFLACGPMGENGEVGWPGKHTPRLGEACNEPGEFRCSFPPEDSRMVLRCDGGEWAPSQKCQEDNTCNWAGPWEAYCAGPVVN